jgi:hypothetical protein
VTKSPTECPAVKHSIECSLVTLKIGLPRSCSVKNFKQSYHRLHNYRKKKKGKDVTIIMIILHPTRSKKDKTND